MRSFSTQVLLIVCASLMCISSSVSGATVIFQDNFENQVVGSHLATLTPLAGSYGAASNATVVCDSTTVPPGIGGAGSEKFVESVLVVGNVYQDRMLISDANQAATANKVVTFNLDYYTVGGGASVGPSIMTLNTADAWTGDNYGFGWGIAVNQDGSISQWAPNVSGMTATGLTARTDTWIPIQVVADYGAGTYEAIVDGHSFAGTMLVHDFKRLEIAPNSYAAAYCYDNVVISTIPEPGSLMLVATGILGLMAYAWRNRR